MTVAVEDELSLDAMVASIKNDFSELSAIFKTSGEVTTCSGGHVSIRAHYLPFRNGKPRVGELLDIVRGYICNFALSRSEIASAHKSVEGKSDQQKMLTYNKLRDDAADLFMKAQKSTSRSGECGELLLYLLTEWILQAPQVMAKMSLKTNGQMPVHGSDGIHLKYDESNDRLIFFWGESKFHSTVGGAISSAVTSISETIKYDKLKEDINLVRRYVSLSGLDGLAQSKLLEFLDPLNSNYDKKIDASVCLIGFDFNGFEKLGQVPSDQLEVRFLELLQPAINAATETLAKALDSAGIHHHTMEVFFLPLDSVANMRVEFHNRIGWKS